MKNDQEGKADPGITSLQLGAAYRQGDIIGQDFEVFSVLGKGGFGVVYGVYDRQTVNLYALKTFRDEYLADAKIRDLFRKEASIWVDLGRHPNLVRAYFVDEISGRLYIAMEYIAPNEHGMNTLDDYLQRQPPDLAQSLRWAIQVCHGMEYAYSKGVRAHRDIKPENIMISQNGMAKITDFGLASVLSASLAKPGERLSPRKDSSAFSEQIMNGVGTLPYMPHEQFDNAAGCDERSDIYAFGVVLFQMASGGQLPFLASPPRDDSQEERMRFRLTMFRLHFKAAVPQLDSPLFPIIQRCLEKKPGRRYQSFTSLRSDLEPLLKRQNGEVTMLPQFRDLDVEEWNYKGISFDSLGRYEEAIRCFDQALELNERLADAWSNKGMSLGKLGRYGEAINCLEMALVIDPQNARAYSNYGICLNSLGRYEEAVRVLGQALELDPHNIGAWTNMSNSLNKLGRYAEAISCLDKVLELDPHNVGAWNNKGNNLEILYHYEESIRCYDQALIIDPFHTGACYNKAIAEDNFGRRQDAARSYQRFIVLASAQDKEHIEHANQRIRELEGE